MNNTQNYIQEDEIDLRELFLKIWHKRFFIASFTLVITILAGIFAFMKTPFYKASALIEIGTYQLDNNNNNNNNNKILIDNANQLQTKLTLLHVDMLKNEKDRESFIDSISVPKNQSGFIEINALGISNELAIKEIEKVFTNIKEDHKNSLNDIQASNKNNLKVISNQIDKSLKDIASFNKKELNVVEMLEILKIKEKIDGLEVKKQNLENALLDSNFKNTKIVGTILINDYPVKPKKKLIVAVSFVTSFILSIFLVFFIDFIQSFRKKDS